MYKTRSRNIQRSAGRDATLTPEALQRQEESGRRHCAIATAHVGKLIEGTVVHILDRGAVVDVGGVSCFIHISELADSYLSHPSQVLEKGKCYEFRILEVTLDRHQNTTFRLTAKSRHEGRVPGGHQEKSHFGNHPFAGLVDLMKRCK